MGIFFYRAEMTGLHFFEIFNFALIFLVFASSCTRQCECYFLTVKIKEKKIKMKSVILVHRMC